jgi:putative FmdB family regulatory protein
VLCDLLDGRLEVNMPIYEYRCLGCGKVSSFFTRSLNVTLEPVCSYCRGRDMQRRMSSFAMGKSAQSADQQYPASSGRPPLEYYSDPRNIGRQVEESFKRYGMEMPSSVRSAIDAAREGELPKGLDT